MYIKPLGKDEIFVSDVLVKGFCANADGRFYAEIYDPVADRTYKMEIEGETYRRELENLFDMAGV